MSHTSHLFKLVSTLVFAVLCSQMIIVNAQSVFQNELWTGSNSLSERGASGLEVNNNGDLALVSQVVTGGVSDILLTPLQNNGHIICPDDYYGSSNQQSDIPRYMQKAYDISVIGGITTQNGFIIVGETGPNNNKNLLLLRVDAGGNILWAGSYGSSTTNESGSCVLQTADGGFIAVGQSTNTVSNISQTFVLRVNSSGTVVWSNLYNFGKSSQAYYIDKAPNVAGIPSYIITGQVSQSNGSSDLMLMHINNTTGAVSWANRYYGNNLNTYAEVGKCVKTISNNMGFVVTGTLGNANNRYNFTLRTQLNGTLVWAKVCRITNAVNMNTAGIVEVPNNGGFTIAGDALLDNRNLVYLFNISPNGNTINWSYTYDYQANGHFASDLRRTNNGDFLITGYLNRNVAGATNASIYVIRTDALGITPNICPETQRDMIINTVNKVAALQANITNSDGSLMEFFRQKPCANEQWCGITVPIGNKNNLSNNANNMLGLQCYPNPTNGIVRVSSPTELTANVLVYNTMGQLIAETPLFNQTAELDLRNYPKGLYFVAIMQDNKIVERAKLVLTK